ncbi:hypothetical protein P154DRAFT_532002 [Amniculicola lignicola CBS 123094]|uniref:Uncharacterized protein n=1 Tax=Amniculicola lignicola CBS 123094 TaxID=1392246 RepID=A0A6A5WNV6_9PLEO|nr:hypothetical protein P154DRAFT_532002 [Amniculicola lignicola CBS 123094]
MVPTPWIGRYTALAPDYLDESDTPSGNLFKQWLRKPVFFQTAASLPSNTPNNQYLSSTPIFKHQPTELGIYLGDNEEVIRDLWKVYLRERDVRVSHIFWPVTLNNVELKKYKMNGCQGIPMCQY